MLKRFYFIVICLAIMSLGFAQIEKRATMYYDAGVKAAAKGLFPDAILSFKMAVALNKKFDSAYAEMGTAYYKSNKIDSALSCYRNSVTINPKMTASYVAMGNIYRDVKNQYDDAISCYFSALKNDNANKVTYYSLAWCYNAKQQYDSAMVYAVKALDIDNDYRAPYNELAHAVRRSEKYLAGIEQFKKHMAISPIDLPRYYAGLCYLAINDKEGASKMYDELLKVNPKLAETLKKKIETQTVK
jgi:tetratricopeptide (TPR) repeat protein